MFIFARNSQNRLTILMTQLNTVSYLLLCFFLLTLLLTSCKTPEPSAQQQPLEAFFDSLLRTNSDAFNRYDWEAAASIFDEAGTYSQPAYGIHQQGKTVLDSVMKDVMEYHRKDSLQASVRLETKSLVVEDSMAYQVLKQHLTLHSPKQSPQQSASTWILVWKRLNKNEWKISYQLVYP